VGRDQRSGTLALYFSRAIGRWDYAFANFAALISAMLAVTVVPQALLFVGNALAASDFFQYVQDEWRQAPAAIASGLLLSVMVAAIGLAIASQTPRRAYSTVAILAVFVLGSVIGATLLNVSGHDIGRFSLLLSPFHVVTGFTLWFFGVPPEARSQMAKADLPGALYAIAAVAISMAALGILLWRYRRIVA
jgi:ABC-2 type transport system permease protein